MTKTPEERDTFSHDERRAVIRRPSPIVTSKASDDFYEPSHPGYPDYSSLFTNRGSFFFRRIVRQPDRWWRKERWLRTGEIWCPESGEFNVEI